MRVFASSLPEEVKPCSLHKEGTRIISQYRINWYTVKADYNLIDTDQFWTKLTCPQGTKTAYVGYYGDIEWCEWEGDMHSQYSSKGVDFILPDRFKVNPGPGKVKIRWWLYEQLAKEKRIFKNDRYYVFCLGREPKEQWRNGAGEPTCDMDTELSHLIGIISIEPTFDFSTHPKSKVLHITSNSLVSIIQERHRCKGYTRVFTITRANHRSFHLEVCKKRFIVPVENIQKLLYAINTCSWRKNNRLHKLLSPVMQMLVEYKNSGKLHKVTIQYENGAWYLIDPPNCYQTPYPHLLFEVEKQLREYRQK